MGRPLIVPFPYFVEELEPTVPGSGPVAFLEDVLRGLAAKQRLLPRDCIRRGDGISDTRGKSTPAKG
jgi:hypothetical protein